MRRRSIFWCLSCAAAIAAPGCREAKQAQAPSAGSVLVLSAASTSDAITEAARAYEARTGVTVRTTTGGSNTLARQILAGAPGDVFLSANHHWAEMVRTEGLALEMRDLLSNRLVIVTPAGNPANVQTPQDLHAAAVRRVALAGELVPAGMYAEQALREAGLYEALVDDGRIARGQDVRLTLGWVEAGEAEAGIVYATDARASSRIEVVYTFPADMHDPITYPLMLLKTGNDPDAGRAFYEYLLSDEARAIFEKHGFVPAPAEAVVAP